MLVVEMAPMRIGVSPDLRERCMEGGRRGSTREVGGQEEGDGQGGRER